MLFRSDWEADLAKMEGDLKGISQERMNKAKKEYDEVDKKVRAIGAKLTKAVDKLQEVQTYFTTELNAASIQAAHREGKHLPDDDEPANPPGPPAG